MDIRTVKAAYLQLLVQVAKIASKRSVLLAPHAEILLNMVLTASKLYQETGILKVLSKDSNACLRKSKLKLCAQSTANNDQERCGAKRAMSLYARCVFNHSVIASM